MSQNAAQTYLRAKVLTATPEQLQLMLYDGAIRFTEQGRNALMEKKFEQTFELLTKAQRIINELQCTLKHDLAPELCGKLASLYNFVYRKLVEGNTEHKVEPLDEALHILRYQRDTWALLLQQMAKSKVASAANRLDIPAPSSRMEANLSRVA
ncbi:MAG TPA: flagellar export chaperone FliS [Tepidisphaeraceae bacterium]|jgi:flagellar protein FliS